VYELTLVEDDKLESILLTCQDYSKVSFELKFLAKHYQVIQICELHAETNERLKYIPFNHEAQAPQAQA
jgi:hypothetical protein